MSAATHAGLTLDDDQLDRLTRYHEWLIEEAIPAGGIGPDEGPRLKRRHLADSLLFAGYMPQRDVEVWDLGTGVGLPGVPLAIALPTAEFKLIDRSGRRVGLLRRLVRILDLENCTVEQADITRLKGTCDVVVSRASLPPAELGQLVPGLLAPGGLALVAGSWHERPLAPGWVVEEIPVEVLDQSVWLLMMRPA